MIFTLKLQCSPTLNKTGWCLNFGSPEARGPLRRTCEEDNVWVTGKHISPLLEDGNCLWNRSSGGEVEFTHCCSLQKHAAEFLASRPFTLTLFITIQRLTSAPALCPQLQPSRAQTNPQTLSLHPAPCPLLHTLSAGWVNPMPCVFEGHVQSNTQFICPRLVWMLTYYGSEACCHTSQM